MEASVESQDAESGVMPNQQTAPTQELKQEDETPALKTVCNYMPAVFIAAGVVFVIINIIMFFVGVTTTKECPEQPMISIYLIVGGVVGLITKAIPFVRIFYKKVETFECLAWLVLMFEIIWTVLGSYWVYSIYEPDYNMQSEHYCNKTTYLLAFWLLTLSYTFVVIFVIILPCSLICWTLCAASRK